LRATSFFFLGLPSLFEAKSSFSVLQADLTLRHRFYHPFLPKLIESFSFDDSFPVVSTNMVEYDPFNVSFSLQIKTRALFSPPGFFPPPWAFSPPPPSSSRLRFFLESLFPGYVSPLISPTLALSFAFGVDLPHLFLWGELFLDLFCFGLPPYLAATGESTEGLVGETPFLKRLPLLLLLVGEGDRLRNLVPFSEIYRVFFFPFGPPLRRFVRSWVREPF